MFHNALRYDAARVKREVLPALKNATFMTLGQLQQLLLRTTNTKRQRQDNTRNPHFLKKESI